MIVRRATLADVPAIKALETQESLAAHWSCEEYERILGPKTGSGLVLVAEEAAGMAGFLVGLAAGPEWEIENIVVATSARRRHLGTRLVEDFLEQARTTDATAVFLEVRESNHAARGFYEKCGFAESGRRPGYYGEPSESAILYCLRFDGPVNPRVK